jgi:hypothetical protein
MFYSRRKAAVQSRASRETRDSGWFIVIAIEDVEQFGYSQQIDDTPVGREKFEMTAVFSERRKTADDFTEPGTVQIGDPGQIEQDVFVALLKKVIHCSLDFDIPVAQEYHPFDIKNYNIFNFSGREFHAASRI